MRMLLATIADTDTEGRPTRHAARGGPGAVMGSKRIKAIVIDDSGTKPVKAKDGEAFRNLVKEYANFVTESKGAQAYKVQGTMGGLTFLSERTTSLPTRNFTAGSFEGARAIGHRKKVEEMKTQGSRWGVACMPGCLVCCSNIICDENGNYITSGLEYESVAMLGANLGIDDIYAIANMDALADNYGIDNIELGVTLGIAVDAGLLEFGDSARAIELIHEIGKGTTLGRILGQGTAITAKVFGISRVPVVKGQGVPAHEPRAENVTGVTYCTSAMGADHTAGLNLERKASSTEAIEASRQAQINVAIVDSLGLCVNSFIDPGFPMERITALVNAVCGLNLSYADLQDMGKAMLKEERAFNLKAGFAPGADRLPEFFKEEPLPPNNFVFDVPDGEIDSFWDF